MTNRLAAVNVTTKPGGTNADHGLFGAYVDSLGMIVVSGQVAKRETMVRSSGLAVRQMGDQEVDIVKMVEGITKYPWSSWNRRRSAIISKKRFISPRMDAQDPTWIDIPVDVQGAHIDPTSWPGLIPRKRRPRAGISHLDDTVAVILGKIREAKMAGYLFGTGIRLERTVRYVFAILDKLGVPRSRPSIPAISSGKRIPATRDCPARSEIAREISRCKTPIFSSCSAAG